MKPEGWMRGLLVAVAVAFLASPFLFGAWHRAPVPEPDPWLAARGEAPLEFDWRQVLGADDAPRETSWRLLSSAALELPGADFGRLFWLTGLVALATAGVLIFGLRPDAGRPPADSGLARAAWAVFVAATLAAPAYGVHWLLASRAGLALPALATVLACWLLHGSGAPRLRVGCALAAAGFAQTCDLAAWPLWIALLPALLAFCLREELALAPSLGLWALLANAFWLAGAFVPWASRPHHEPGLVHALASDPAATLQRALELAATAAPVPPLEGSIALAVGALGVLWFLGLSCLWAVRWQDTERRSEAAPWLSLAAAGLGTACALAAPSLRGAWPADVQLAVAWPACLFAIGLVGATASLEPRTRRLGWLALVLFVPLSLARTLATAPRVDERVRELHRFGAAQVWRDAIPPARVEADSALRPALADRGAERALVVRGLLRDAPSASLAELTAAEEGPPPPWKVDWKVDATGASGSFEAAVTDPPDLVLWWRAGEVQVLGVAPVERVEAGGWAWHTGPASESEADRKGQHHATGFWLWPRRAVSLGPALPANPATGRGVGGPR